jgi:hypothetical protein
LAAASPQLFQALTSNEQLKSVKIDFMEASAEGKNDRTGQFHVAKADGEEEAMTVLAEMVGIDVEDG